MAVTKTVNVETTNARASTTLTDTTPTVPLPDMPQGLMVIGPQVTLHFVKDEWDKTNSYDYYDVVQVDGTSYIAVQDVPANTEITNTTYWAKWNDPNAQVELLQNTVNTFDARITAAQSSANTAQQTANQAVESVNNIKTKSLYGFVNIIDYGAKGDGSTDNLTAFNDAIEAAGNGGIVYVPEGTYYVSAPINITQPITLIGSNWFSTTILSPANTNCIVVTIPQSSPVESSNGPVIKDLTVKTKLEYWDNRDKNTVTSGIGIDINAAGVLIQNVMSYGFYTGFDLSIPKPGGTIRCILDNCVAFRCHTGISNSISDLLISNCNIGPCDTACSLNGGINMTNMHVWGYKSRALYLNGHFNISNIEIESPFSGDNVIHIQNGSNGYGTINNAIFWNFPDYSSASTKWALVYNDGIVNISNLVYTQPNGGTTAPCLVTCSSKGAASISNAILGPTVTDIGTGDHKAVAGSGRILYDYMAMNASFSGTNSVGAGTHTRTVS